MRRPWIAVQLIIGWVPVGVMIALLVLTAHRASVPGAMFIATHGMLAGIIVCIPVISLTKRWPWPEQLSFGFFLRHVVAALLFALAFVALNSVFASILLRRPVLSVGAGFAPYITLGVWLYVMVAGVLYASQATGRAARAEALAARSQLAALRSQLNPHFLFNALHTVVHLIPREPALASKAAEQVAALLRTTLEEDRDLVPLADELAFVRRYLMIERIRFSDRLVVEEMVAENALDALVPVFALQTLVENAVRHGAAPRIEPTTIVIRAASHAGVMTITVSDDGDGASADALQRSTGSGLKRLRERLAVLYAGKARLDVVSSERPCRPEPSGDGSRSSRNAAEILRFGQDDNRGFTALLSLPHTTTNDGDD